MNGRICYWKNRLKKKNWIQDMNWRKYLEVKGSLKCLKKKKKMYEWKKELNGCLKIKLKSWKNEEFRSEKKTYEVNKLKK